MKKVIVMTALALLFAGCGSGGGGQAVEAEGSSDVVLEEQWEESSLEEESQVEESVSEEEYEEEFPRVFDRSLLEIVDIAENIQRGEKNMEGYLAENYYPEDKDEERHLANSYFIHRKVRYPGTTNHDIERNLYWENITEMYLPLFTDEIPYDGAEIIKEYYLKEYNQYTDGINDMIETIEDRYTTTLSASQRIVNYLDYTVTFSKNYVSVCFKGEYYAAGGGSFIFYTDNFDMHTGEFLKKEDVFVEDFEENLPGLLQMNENAIDYLTTDSILNINWEFQFADEGLIFLVSYGNWQNTWDEYFFYYEDIADHLIISP